MTIVWRLRFLHEIAFLTLCVWLFYKVFYAKMGRELLKLTFSVLFSKFFFEVSEKISIFTLSFRNLSL
jgi:hypothetical protein